MANSLARMDSSVIVATVKLLVSTFIGAAIPVCLVSCQTPSGTTDVQKQEVSVTREAPKVEKKEERKEVPDEPSTNPGQHGVVVPPPVERGEITTMNIEQLFMMKGDGKALVVDVRPRIFYTLGHIEDAISLPLKSFNSSYPKQKPVLDAAVRDKKVIVLYCANVNCPDGYAVAKKLAADGYSSSLYKGGWEEWKAAGLE